ncbi:MAG: hypothetical protein ACO28Q_07855 [Ilumatobacteraceae bacterium]
MLRARLIAIRSRSRHWSSPSERPAIEGSNHDGYFTGATSLIERRTVEGRPRLLARACVLEASRPIRGRVVRCDDETIRADRVMRRNGSEGDVVSSLMGQRFFFTGGFCFARDEAVDFM